MHLALASRTAIAAVLGQPALDAMPDLLGRYLRAVTARGIDTRVVVVDDATSMGQFGLAPIGQVTSDTVRASIMGLRAVIEANGGMLDSVLLFGGDAIFPFFRFANPVTDRRLDPDPIVWSDNPYGVAIEPGTVPNWLAPTLAVGRVFDAGSVEAFTQAIERVIANHAERPARTGSCAVYNADWQSPSLTVARELRAPIDTRMSPPYQISQDSLADLDREVVYMNLHGFDGDAVWKSYDGGLDQFLDVVSPSAFTAETTAGSMLISEACYGAQVSGRTPANSCALSAHIAGATVIGATGLVWGSVLRPWIYVDGGDALAKCVITEMEAPGLSIGAALLAGRRMFLQGHDVNPFEQKTALQFILLGDPSLHARVS